MKAIIYSGAAAAEAALAACTAGIGQSETIYTGPGPYETPDPGLPYSYILKHPDQDLWALVADEKVEAVLGETAADLDDSWFPKISILAPPAA
jgi:hypothetical protein